MVVNDILSSACYGFGVSTPTAYCKAADEPQVTQKAADTGYVQPSAQMDILSYYRNLCSDYPNISFRLGDKEEGMRHEYWMGYNNSMNQAGKNFGEMEQYSMEIDVAVIRKMQSDPELEQHVRGILSSMENCYGNYESMVLADHCDHFYRFLELDETGGLAQGTLAGNGSFSTEDEIREMWQGQEPAATRRLLQRYKQECMETLLRLGEHKEKFQARDEDNPLVS